MGGRDSCCASVGGIGKRQVQLWLFLLLLLPIYAFLFFTSINSPALNPNSIDADDSDSVPIERTIDGHAFRQRKSSDSDKRQSADDSDKRRSADDSDKALALTVGLSRPTHRKINEILGYDPDTLPSSSSYQVHPLPECWSPNCSPDEPNNKRAYTPCGNPAATVWNNQGVDNMVRLVEADGSPYFRNKFLNLAYVAFTNSTNLDPSCAQARSNLAIVNAMLGNHMGAVQTIATATNLQPNNQYFWAIRGFLEDLTHDRFRARQSWNRALEIDPYISERKYFGIMVTNDTHPEKHFLFPVIREANLNTELSGCLDMLAYIEFSRISMANYVHIPPGTQEFFIKNKYFIARDMLPPFVLSAVAKSMKQAREAGSFGTLGDYQSKRFNALNDRISRTIHFQLVDVWRRVALHNLVPTYAFYGGYQPGAILPPHTDKPQCEFTVSFTINQSPYEQPWALSLGSRSKFDKNEKFVGDPKEPLPPEEQIVDALLNPGDALLFMGRHLVHFRRTTLEEGRFLDQLFLHHVQDSFTGWYDI